MEKYITIDTSQMADKMDSVSHNVMATTAAVGVMQTAVINEEKVSSEKICGRLNYGFFNLITAQIEQKVANESSNANALAIELMQQQKALRSLQDRMGKDYNLIASRYVKLFNSLNKELKNRVVELDRPVMELCEQRIKQLQNRICALISSVPVYQSESLTAAQAIAAAHIKRNAQELIGEITNYLKKSNEARALTEHIKHEDLQAEAATFSLPIVISEECGAGNNPVQKVRGNSEMNARLGEKALMSATMAALQAGDKLQWHDADEQTCATVANNFAAMVEAADIPERVKTEMKRLFDRNKDWQTL